MASDGGECVTVRRVVLEMLDRHRFRGVRADAQAASFAGLAWFSGAIACVAWPRDDLAARLPPELVLAAAVDGAASHPVVFVFGEQARPALLRGGLALPMGVAYGEFGIFVPYVQVADDGRLCTYVWRMCSTYFPAVWEGNHRYFAKAIANMRWRDGLFVMTNESDRPLFHAVLDGADDWTPGRDGGPGWLHPVRDAFALPLVGRPEGRPLAWSRFGWDFEAASVRPVRAAAWVDGGLIGDRVARDLDVAAAVAVRDMAWRLSWPNVAA